MKKQQKSSIPTDSIWHKYKSLVDANKKERKSNEQYNHPEPPEFLLDSDKEDEFLEFLEYRSEEGRPVMTDDYSSKSSYLLSKEWICDLLGKNWESYTAKLNIGRRHHIKCEHGTQYYREVEIEKIINILMNIIDNDDIIRLRRRPLITEFPIKDVYTSDDLMKLLNVKDSTLRSYRDNHLLNYSRLGDKIWYTREDVTEFMRSTSCNS